jgi:hypothetical protein
VRDIPVRMRQTRMRNGKKESQAGLLCQAETTSAIGNATEGRTHVIGNSDSGPPRSVL